MDGCPVDCAGASWQCRMGRRSLLWLALLMGQALGVWREASPRGQGLGILSEVELGLGRKRSLETRGSWRGGLWTDGVLRN